MADEQHLLETACDTLLHHEADVIARLNDRVRWNAHDLRRRLTDTAGAEDCRADPARIDHRHLRRQRFLVRLLAHRLHDPRRAQDRNPADDPQRRIQRLLRQLLPFRDRHRHDTAMILADELFIHIAQHDLRTRVDGGPPHLHLQPRLRHRAHALPRAERKTWRIHQLHRHDDRRPMRTIQIIARILETSRDARPPMRLGRLHRDRELRPLRRKDRHLLWKFSSHSQNRCLHRPRRRSAGGMPFPERLRHHFLCVHNSSHT